MTSIVSGSEKRHSDPVLSKDGRDFVLASLLTYEKCPQDITHILLTSQTLNENVSSSPAENIATDEMWEYQQYSEKMGSWGSTKEHFVESLKRWWSPSGGSSDDVGIVLPLLSSARARAMHGGKAFLALSKWHVDRATVDTDICGWSYTNSLGSSLQQNDIPEDLGHSGARANEAKASPDSDAPVWSNENCVFSKVRRRRWVRLKCLSNVHEGCKTWLSDRIRTLDVINSFRDQVVEFFFENQRYMPLAGYGGADNLLLTDPGEFCNVDMSCSQMVDPKSSGASVNDDGITKEKKIPGWEWKTSWQVRPTSDANGDGWMYAINFSDYNDDFQGTPKPRPLIDFVRRRCWTRTRHYCGNMPSQESQDVSRLLAKASSSCEDKQAEGMRFKLNAVSRGEQSGKDNTPVNTKEQCSIEDKVPFLWPRATSDTATNTWRELSRREVQEYYRVRGKDYMKSRKKVASNGSLCELVACEFFNVGDKVQLHAAKRRKRNTYLQAARSNGDISFYYIISVITPSPPHHTLLMYYRMPDVDKLPKHFQHLWNKFLNGDDAFRSERWKIIPRIQEGPWVVKSSVGTKPALLGQKVDQKYFLAENYCEVDIDVASSKVATMLTGLIVASMQQLTIDLAFTLEGREEDELREEIIGTIRLQKVNLLSTVRCNDFVDDE